MFVNMLRKLSLTYIITPTLIFLLNWLRMPYAITFSAILVGVIVYTLQRIPPEKTSLKWWELSLLAILAFTMAILYGYGELRGQTNDSITNNFKYFDLISKQWPIHYDNQGYMCYYMGYYFPVAVLGKFLGIQYAHWIDLCWVSGGITIIFCWIFQLSPHPHKWLILLIMLFFADSLNTIHRLLEFTPIQSRHFISWGIALDLNREFPYLLHVSSPLNKSIQWAAQHTLAVGIVTLWLLDCFKTNAITTASLVAVSLGVAGCLLWSPLSALGVLPLFLVLLWHNKSVVIQPRYLILLLLISCSIVPVLLYLSSNGSINSNTNYFIWQSDTRTWPFWYGLYLLMFFGVWFGLYYQKLNQDDFVLVCVAFAVVCVGGIYRMGKWNDFNNRLAISSLFVFSYFAGKALYSKFSLDKTTIIYLVFFMLCMRRPILELIDSWQYKKPLNTIEKPFISGATNTIECLTNRYSVQEAKQYLMRKDTFFEKYLIKKPTQQRATD
jgi:hypothetical protein